MFVEFSIFFTWISLSHHFFYAQPVNVQLVSVFIPFFYDRFIYSIPSPCQYICASIFIVVSTIQFRFSNLFLFYFVIYLLIWCNFFCSLDWLFVQHHFVAIFTLTQRENDHTRKIHLYTQTKNKSIHLKKKITMENYDKFSQFRFL